ncbi:hypothetical protein WH47_04427 [Habropoda laboriosa]|uniref:Uncharacterized protein n=1 Tax=Habropoda laboriosa TaxID=597456 RepID=A0A0L7QWP2_9HYME|nr:hypothetical protein WH47_04427 [Habropoda laboriosa]
MDVASNVAQIKSQSLKGQDWTYEKSGNPSTQLYGSEYISTTTKNPLEEETAYSRVISDMNETESFNEEVTIVNAIENPDTEINEEHDLILSTSNDKKFTSPYVETSTAFNVYNTADRTEKQFDETSDVDESKNIDSDITQSQEDSLRPGIFVNDSEAANRFEDDSKEDETSIRYDYSTNEESKDPDNTSKQEFFLLFLPVLQSGLKNTEPLGNSAENNNGEGAAVTTEMSPIEIDNIGGMSEGELISDKNSNNSEDILWYDRSYYDTHLPENPETFADSNEYPQAEESKHEELKDLDSTSKQEFFLLLLPVLQSGLRNTEPLENSTGNKDGEGADVTMEKSLIEVDNIEGISEGELISDVDSNIYKDTVISDSNSEDRDVLKQAKKCTDSNEYPQIEESKYEEKVEGISEGELITDENSNTHMFTVISGSSSEGRDVLKQAEILRNSNKYPQTEESKHEEKVEGISEGELISDENSNAHIIIVISDSSSEDKDVSTEAEIFTDSNAHLQTEESKHEESKDADTLGKMEVLENFVLFVPILRNASGHTEVLKNSTENNNREKITVTLVKFRNEMESTEGRSKDESTSDENSSISEDVIYEDTNISSYPEIFTHSNEYSQTKKSMHEEWKNLDSTGTDELSDSNDHYNAPLSAENYEDIDSSQSSSSFFNGFFSSRNLFKDVVASDKYKMEADWARYVFLLKC